MVGGHCINAWSKTQAVMAKSSAESELYSVVKGATEGLGLITLHNDMGESRQVTLNLDATAAKGILERQGISKGRHIDVNVLWLQQQTAKNIIPLIKVPGTDNCSDLLTKHLVGPILNKHVAAMGLVFQEGRAEKAALLHALYQQRGRSIDALATDKWSERGEKEQWVRVHRVPREELFTPYRVPRGPGKKTRLKSTRRTIGVDEFGKEFDFIDDWTEENRAHKMMSSRWTGITLFATVAYDDKVFGGDQRRQRQRSEGFSRSGGGPSISTRATEVKKSWADYSD